MNVTDLKGQERRTVTERSKVSVSKVSPECQPVSDRSVGWEASEGVSGKPEYRIVVNVTALVQH